MLGATRVVLTLPSGSDLELRPGASVTLGRAHAVGAASAFVGREQARIAFDGAPGGAVTLTSLSAVNATYVFRADPATRPVRVCAQQSCELCDGDQIGLVGKEQLVGVALDAQPWLAPAAEAAPAHAVDESAGERGEGARPAATPRKRPALGPACCDLAALTKRAQPPRTDDDAATPAGAESAAAAGAPSVEPPPPCAPALEMTPLSTHTPLAMAWRAHAGELLVGTPLAGVPSDEVRALALFDLDHTLLRWTISSGFPRAVDDYALPSVVPLRLRELAASGHAICILANNAGIRGALTGALAARTKELVERVARALAPVPLVALIATKKPSTFRRPLPGMYRHLVGAVLPDAARVEPAHTLIVATAPSAPMGDGCDDGRAFAAALGDGVRFATPEELFGFRTASGGGWREWRPAADGTGAEGGCASVAAGGDLSLLGALLAGHLRGPVLLILCGIAGSGKSTFCAELLRARATRADDVALTDWIVACQDTASACGTKPGRRERVEQLAAEALSAGSSVVIDRTNLSREQRAHFARIGRAAGARVLALALRTPTAECAARVRERTGHPGRVEGAGSLAVVRAHAAALDLPDADAERIDAVVLCSAEHACAAAHMFALGVVRTGAAAPSRRAHEHGQLALVPSHGIAPGAALELPPFGWGTYEVGVNAVPAALNAARGASAGRAAVQLDCASTYKNERAVGGALRAWLATRDAPAPFIVAKLAKAVTEASAVRDAALKSTDALGVAHADLLLLHWPCDVIEMGSLGAVWAAMLELLAGPSPACRAVGVCNFTVGALELLPSAPAAVQVERHPLLPQWDLQLYCALRGICLIAHMPLGGRSGAPTLLAHPVVERVARESGRTAAQVLLRWNVQHGCAVVTRASAAHARENGDLAFVLSAEHMQLLDSMSAVGTTRFLSAERVPFMRRHGAAYSW